MDFVQAIRHEQHELAEAQIPTPAASKTEGQTGRLTLVSEYFRKQKR